MIQLLLDTHIFLWLITGDSRLPDFFREAILESENSVFLSAASVWEIIIKYNLGKLPTAGIARDIHSASARASHD